MEYTISRKTDANFETVVEDVTDALAEEGFGVLCDIDVQATLREKLDVEFQQYRILGACNPALAHEAMDHERELGTLLPCNVIVYETEEGDVGVSAVNPAQLLSVVDNPELDPIATEVTDRFERVLDAAV
jgi:uncharacterized protein (DUF302 family)